FRRNIHPTFGGPWQSCSCPAQDSEARVPKEYRVLSLIGHRLPPFSLRTLSEDTLFYFFYNFPGEEYQIGAANELYYRDWRYHKSLHVWMMRSQRGYVKEHGPTFEKGTYLVFDHTHWRKVQVELMIEYRELEDRPELPHYLRLLLTQQLFQQWDPFCFDQSNRLRTFKWKLFATCRNIFFFSRKKLML
ncbi:unnamed protein product, partial [Gongylonema pulchrum]|uniref:NOT2_3_5 domain-containing protein n=1 Tax=Gongylonema pulchrum TaxID=637853 RepID=A0A183EE37_9BILA